MKLNVQEDLEVADLLALHKQLLVMHECIPFTVDSVDWLPTYWIGCICSDSGLENNDSECKTCGLYVFGQEYPFPCPDC